VLKAWLAIKYFILQSKYEKNVELTSLLKQKIDEIENLRFHQSSQIDNQIEQIKKLYKQLEKA
jgi:CII-binding regulator of phage lambda lysogenization HflD